MTFSGIDGINCIPLSMAKIRVDSGMFTHAEIWGEKGSYEIRFTNPEALWNGQYLTLSSARDLHSTKVFKSLDAAVSDLKRLDIKNVKIGDSVLMPREFK